MCRTPISTWSGSRTTENGAQMAWAEVVMSEILSIKPKMVALSTRLTLRKQTARQLCLSSRLRDTFAPKYCTLISMFVRTLYCLIACHLTWSETYQIERLVVSSAPPQGAAVALILMTAECPHRSSSVSLSHQDHPYRSSCYPCRIWKVRRFDCMS